MQLSLNSAFVFPTDWLSLSFVQSCWHFLGLETSKHAQTLLANICAVLVHDGMPEFCPRSICQQIQIYLCRSCWLWFVRLGLKLELLSDLLREIFLWHRGRWHDFFFISCKSHTPWVFQRKSAIWDLQSFTHFFQLEPHQCRARCSPVQVNCAPNWALSWDWNCW